jgi:hypothetical protein
MDLRVGYRPGILVLARRRLRPARRIRQFDRAGCRAAGFSRLAYGGTASSPSEAGWYSLKYCDVNRSALLTPSFSEENMGGSFGPSPKLCVVNDNSHFNEIFSEPTYENLLVFHPTGSSRGGTLGRHTRAVFGSMELSGSSVRQSSSLPQGQATGGFPNPAHRCRDGSPR